MFQEKALAFLYCISPVHPGAGTALGAVDNPIQRERHTGHPTIAGSGIKGALRDHFKGGNHDELLAVFGPEPDASQEHAGAVSFSDAQLVLFPVRSLSEAYVYVTSPTALARLQRLAGVAGIEEAAMWNIPEPHEGEYVSLASDAGLPESLLLESFEFKKVSGNGDGSPISSFIAKSAQPEWIPGADFFGEKMRKHTIVLHDHEFCYFVQNATLVEPHVRINDASGTAQKGGLFYVENIPPESVLVSLVMASASRRADVKKEAKEVLNKLREWLEKKNVVQIGGDATTGRGQILVTVTRREG